MRVDPVDSGPIMGRQECSLYVRCPQQAPPSLSALSLTLLKRTRVGNPTIAIVCTSTNCIIRIFASIRLNSLR